MYEFRGSTLLEAVQQAVGRSDLQLSHKNLVKRKGKFDFSARMRLSSVLFVGEGNFSFSLSLAKCQAGPVSSILATSYEAEDDLTDTAYQNARKLIGLGVQVKTGVDATRLSETIGSRRFATIIFQFPKLRVSRSEVWPESKPCFGLALSEKQPFAPETRWRCRDFHGGQPIL